MASVLTSVGRRVGGSPRQLFLDILSALNLVRDEVLVVEIANLATATAYHVNVPGSATIMEIKTVIDGALTTGDAVLTAAHNGTGSFVGITNGVVTITQSGSAAADVDVATPTALNVAPAAGCVLRLTKSGDNDATVSCRVTITLRKPVASFISLQS